LELDEHAAYERRTGDVRALCVVITPSSLQTCGMAHTTTATTFIAGAAGLIGTALLLTLPAATADTRQAAPVRIIDVQLSRFAFSPERLEVRVGEQVRLNIRSVDGTHGFQVKELGLNVRVPSGGSAVTVDLTPKEAGTFPIKCSEYCGSGHRRMQASLVVTPGS
jgi:cytochrome c oxidase subunit 2